MSAEPQVFSYYIEGLCCAEEVSLLRRCLAPHVAEETLGFDLVSARLTVTAVAELEPQVVKAISSSGMKAVPWEEHAKRRAISGHDRGADTRLVACMASGLLFAAGLLMHILDAGVWPTRLACLASILAGWAFVAPRAWASLRRFSPDMNLLMTVALVGAVVIGEWLEGASVAFLFSLALVLESRSVARARRSIGALLGNAPREARVISCCGSCDHMKPVEEVAVGARILVKPGERIALDGTVTKGASSVNEAPLTGESQPVAKGPGSTVLAGTINGEGALEFTAGKVAADSLFARIIRMVEEAHRHRAASEQWVDKFARVYTPAMMGLAAGIAVVPPLLGFGSFAQWFYQGLVLLVIACPCALVISTPMTIVAGLTRAARQGVLIKGGAWLEEIGRVRAMAFDKTGTLTEGRFALSTLEPLDGVTTDEALRVAAAIEQQSEHPLAGAVVDAARRAGVSVGRAEDFRAIPGLGAEASVEGRRCWIGSAVLARERAEEGFVAWEGLGGLTRHGGASLLFLGCDGALLAVLALQDQVRAEAARAVADLRALGIGKVAVLSGDRREAVVQLAEELELDEIHAGLLPDAKVEAVRRLVASENHVAMVGDGINDAPALATASVSVAMGGRGTDAAIEAADIALMGDDLRKLPWLVAHSRATLAVLKQNIAGALGIKVVFLALALGGVASLWMAILADIGGTFLVIANSMRLLRR